MPPLVVEMIDLVFRRQLQQILVDVVVRQIRAYRAGRLRRWRNSLVFLCFRLLTEDKGRNFLLDRHVCVIPHFPINRCLHYI